LDLDEKAQPDHTLGTHRIIRRTFDFWKH